MQPYARSGKFGARPATKLPSKKPAVAGPDDLYEDDADEAADLDFDDEEAIDRVGTPGESDDE